MDAINTYLKNSRVFSDDQDEVVSQAFEQLCDFIIYLDKNRQKIDVRIIRSNLLWHEKIKETESKYTIIWDTGYWEFFEDFLSAFCYINDYYRNYIESEKTKEDASNIALLLDKRLVAFASDVFFYLAKRHYQCNNRAAMIFAKESVKYGFHVNNYPKEFNENILNIIKIAKIYILTHELEHILSELCPEVRNNAGESFKYILSNIVQTNSFDFSESEIDLLKSYISGGYAGIFEETYCDTHAFFEVFEFIAWLQHSSEKEMFGTYPDYTLTIKLLRIFDTFCKGLFSITNEFIRKKKYNKSDRVEDKLIDHNNNYLLRDTLCEKIELFQILARANKYGMEVSLDDFDISDSLIGYDIFLGKHFNRLLHDAIKLIDNENYSRYNTLNSKEEIIDFLFD